VTATGAGGDPNVGMPLLAASDQPDRTGQPRQHVPGDDRPLVEGTREPNAFGAVLFRDPARSSGAADLLIAPEGEVNRPGRRESVIQEFFHRLKDRDMGELVVECSPAPDRTVPDLPRERWNAPPVSICGDDVVVSHQENRCVVAGTGSTPLLAIPSGVPPVGEAVFVGGVPLEVAVDQRKEFDHPLLPCPESLAGGGRIVRVGDGRNPDRFGELGRPNGRE
jgi:hypothetical protein